MKQMLEWLSRLFGAPSSSSVAKERLRLVLLSDHLALAPDVIEALRRDLFDVITRYVVVDEANSDVSFEHKDQGIAMLANIPILSLKERPTAPQEIAPPPEDPSPPAAPRRRRRRKSSALPQAAPAQ